MEKAHRMVIRLLLIFLHRSNSDTAAHVKNHQQLQYKVFCCCRRTGWCMCHCRTGQYHCMQDKVMPGQAGATAGHGGVQGGATTGQSSAATGQGSAASGQGSAATGKLWP